MERLLTVIACGLLAAVAFGLLGGLFGGAVRVLAKLRDRVPDDTLGDALRNGVRGGAGFLAVLGALIGGLIACLEPAPREAFDALAAGVGAMGTLMVVIVVGIAIPTTALVWLALWYRRQGSPPSGRN